MTRGARRAATAQRILRAARDEFGAKGYEATTIRAIATIAGVDPSLVIQHFGSKGALFASAVQIPAGEGREADDHMLEVLARRLGDLPPETHALLRSMLTVPEAGEAVREHLDERVDNLAGSLGEGEDTRVRALVIVSSILGLTITRHFLGLRAFDDVDTDAVIRVARCWIDSVDGDIERSR